MKLENIYHSNIFIFRRKWFNMSDYAPPNNFYIIEESNNNYYLTRYIQASCKFQKISN